VCGTANATTWDIPGAVTASLAWNGSTDTVTTTVSGGASPDTPITSWTATVLTNNSSPNFVHSGSGQPPSTFNDIAIADGSYGVRYQVCNAVGCAPTFEDCCTAVALTGPPDQMAAPPLSYEHTATGGLRIYVLFEEPNMNGAPLQHFDYQVEYMGSSGDLHVQPVESRTQTNPWIHGWHQYWGPQTDGANLGETLTWWVKARAVNSEGVGDWSPKSEITPPLTTRPVPTLTVGLGSASTACTVPANDPTRGCYNLGVTMSGGAETEVARCVAWTNPGTWEQYGTIGLGNGYNEGCPYSLAGRHVAVVVGADIVGTPNSNTITVPPPAAASNVYGTWPTN